MRHFHRLISKDRRKLQCSFCSESLGEARRLIAGPGKLYICDECVRVSCEIMKEDPPDTNDATTHE